MVDLLQLSPAEVAELKRADFSLGCTAEQARSTWRAAPVRAFVASSAGNGGQPVLVLMPTAFVEAEPFVVHTHFHGDFTAVGAPGGVHTLAIAEQLERAPQRLWVLPEATGKVGGKGTDWSNVVDHRALLVEALAFVPLVARPDTRFVTSAHSSGGRALAAAVATASLWAHQLVLLDCLYERADGPGANTALLEALKGGALDAVEQFVLVASGSYPTARDEAFLAAAKGRARLEPLRPRAGMSAHAAAARHHLVPSP